MKKMTIAAVAVSFLLPLGAQANTHRMTEDQLIQLATERGTCGDRAVLSARYVNETENRVMVTCDDAEGYVPLAAGLGAGGTGAAVGLVLLVAIAAGAGGSTPDSQ